MMNHSEHDLLSAYADGELDAPERELVDAHLTACADARALLDAIRATLVDVRSLSEPPMDPQVSFAIRAAVARERRLSGRGRRFAWAGAAAAASLIVVAGFIALTPGRDAPDSGAGATLNALELQSDQNYTKATAGALLSDFVTGAYRSRGAPQPMTAAQAPADDAAEGSTETTRGEFRAVTPDAAVGDCLATIERESDSVRLVRSIEARFEGEPAYVLLFEVPARNPGRVELWILSRATCDVRFFRQEPIRR